MRFFKDPLTVKVFNIIFFFGMGLSLVLLSSLKHTIGDFDVYYNSSYNYLNNAPVYVAHNGINEFKYSPLFLLIFSPLTFLSKIQALYVWTTLNVFFLYGIFYFLNKLKLISFNNWKDSLIVVFLFALTGRYIFTNSELGQSNMLLCFLMVWTMYLEINKKYFGAGVVLALSLMIKFFPLLFVLYYLLRRRFKLLTYAFLMIVVFLLLPIIFNGFKLNFQYLHAWFVLLKSTPPILLYSVKNSSFLSFFSWFFVARHEPYYIFDYEFIKKGLTPQVYYGWGIACFVFFVAFFYDTFFVKDKTLEVSLIDYSCLFVCGLLFNPLSYLNAFVFLIVPCFFILRHLFHASFNKEYLLPITFLLLISFLLMMFDNRFFIKDINSYYIVLQLKFLMWSCIFVYLALLLVKDSLKSKS